MKKFVCIALAACFVVALVSFSSSAAVVNDVTNLTPDTPYFQLFPSLGIGWSAYFSNLNNNSWFFNSDLNYSTPTVIGDRLTFPFSQDYTVPYYSGRALSLSFNLDFTVSDHGYLSLVPDNVDLSNSAIFTSCYAVIQFSDGSQKTLLYDSFILKDEELGEIVDPSSDAYWETRKEPSPWNFSIYALFDLTPFVGKTITQTYINFPYGSSTIYYSNEDLNSYLTLTDVSANIDFAYSPFEDVVQDDLTDIKTELGTIDQDVNRVNQSVTDLKDTIEDFQQDLTISDSSISSDISDKQDIIDSIQDAMQNDNALLDDNLNDMITGFPGAQDPFHNAPSPDGFFAVDFIQQLWSFIKAQTIFFDFIFLGLCFCLATFILRR